MIIEVSFSLSSGCRVEIFMTRFLVEDSPNYFRSRKFYIDLEDDSNLKYEGF